MQEIFMWREFKSVVE